MNLYKHLVHLKSTTGNQSVLAFVYKFGVYIWRCCYDGNPVCRTSQIASEHLGQVTPDPEKVSHVRTNKPDGRNTRETQPTQWRNHMWETAGGPWLMKQAA